MAHATLAGSSGAQRDYVRAVPMRHSDLLGRPRAAAVWSPVARAATRSTRPRRRRPRAHVVPPVDNAHGRRGRAPGPQPGGRRGAVADGGLYGIAEDRDRHGRGGGPRLRSVFFFQAEDGIRDLAVTGVQTCALPI